MDEVDTSTFRRLIDKSQEAFLLAIELYNRPTIQYRVEGCAFFLCNAWELMLKAYLIRKNGLNSIYYSKSDRTLSLEDCLKRVFTNRHDPLRRNMDKVIEVRNTSTHFIVQEYESFYVPLLQASVENYDEQMRRLLGVEVSDRVPENYLMLSVRRSLVDEDECRGRYDSRVLNKMLDRMEGIRTTEHELENRRFSCTYVTELRLTKQKSADISVNVSKDAEATVTVMKRLVDVKSKYPYRPKAVVKEICARIRRGNVLLLQEGTDTKERTKSRQPFNMYLFGLFTSFYSMKGDERYSYDSSMEGEGSSYIYSQQAVDLIWEKIKENPGGIIDRLKSDLDKSGPTPGAREF